MVARPWAPAVGSAALGLALATGSRVMTLVAAVVAMVVLCGCGAPSLGALAAALRGGAAVGEPASSRSTERGGSKTGAWSTCPHILPAAEAISVASGDEG